MQLSAIDPTTSPLSAEQAALVNQLVGSLTPPQVAWLGGYLTGVAGFTQSLLGLMQPGLPGQLPAGQPMPVSDGAASLTVLFGTQTGNAEKLAKQVQRQAQAKGLSVQLKDMGQYRHPQLKQEKNLLIIVSTHGEGDPPDRVAELHGHLHGKRAPKLDGLNYSVLALGDRTYRHFCKIGKDFDEVLAKLGGTRLVPRTDCDVDYEDAAEAWIDSVLEAFATKVGNGAPAPQPGFGGFPAIGGLAAASPYNRKNPFQATLLERLILNDEGSAKQTLHVELSLEGSGLTFEPGDSLGIYPTNNPATVAHLIAAAKLDPSTVVTSHEGEGGPLSEILSRAYEITTLTPDVVAKYADLSGIAALKELTAEDRWDDLQDYLAGRDVADMLTDYPSELFANDLLEILRKIPPRLYSLANSLEAYPDEAHLCIAIVRYESHGRGREGVCSTFLHERVEEDGKVPVYVHSNNYFRLPENPSTPIVMIGPGTGVAPFRAFLQHREASGADGPNWLFFGEQHFHTDFLYQVEWQQWLKSGLLTKMHVAFSRDQDHKIYVQDRLRENGAELYQWLQNGAHLYVCGDESRMAHDVHAALIEIIAEQAKITHDDALEYMKTLQRDNRYLRDVY